MALQQLFAVLDWFVETQVLPPRDLVLQTLSSAWVPVSVALAQVSVALAQVWVALAQVWVAPVLLSVAPVPVWVAPVLLSPLQLSAVYFALEFSV